MNGAGKAGIGGPSRVQEFTDGKLPEIKSYSQSSVAKNII